MSLPQFLNRKPREIGQLRNDYAPPKTQVTQAVDDMIERMRLQPLSDDFISFGEPEKPPPPSQIDLLEELAVILRRLTWSQMTEFGTGINADPKNIHEWSKR